MNHPRSKLASWMGAVLFFAGLPIALLLLGWQFLTTQEVGRLTRQLLTRLDRNLFRLHREGNDAYFIQKELNFFYGRLNEERLTAQTARQAYLRLKKSRLPFINLYLFDARGEFIQCPGENRKYKAMVQKLFLALAEPEMQGQSKLLARYRSIFQSFLGDIEPSDIVYDKSTLLRVHLNGKPGFFYWNTLYLTPPTTEASTGDGRTAEATFQGGVVAFFEEREIPRQQAIRTMIRDFNQAGDPDEGYALLDLAEPRDSYVPATVRRRLRTSPTRLVREARAIQRQFSRQKIDPARVMAIFPFESGKVLVGLHGLRLPGHGRLRVLIWGLALAILLLVASWSHRILVSRPQVFFSIKKKLIALFLYATAIPVTAFILLGSQYAVEERQVMIQERFTQLASLLENIDENFNAAVQRLQDIFRRLSRAKPVARLDQTRLRQITEHLRQKDLLSQAFILDQKGKMLFNMRFEKGRDLISRFVPTLARKLFASKFGSGGSDLGARMSDVMVESLTDSFAELVSGGGGGKSAYARLFEQTDQIHEFWFGRGAYFLFSAFVPAPAGRHPNVLILMQSAQDLARRYLRTVVRLNHRAREEDNPVRLAMMSRQRGYSPYPAGFSKYPFGKDLYDKVLTTETQHTAVEEMGGEPYLVLASPLKKLPNFLLFAMFPQARIDAVVDRLTRRIALIAVVSGVFAFCIGLVLARGFLWPITELASGIAAIERRQFNYRIPELAHDEFGDLGSTFNRVITSLEELAIGKVVQETLFPAGPLTLGEFQIAGRSQAVSDLGGDYFDYFALDERFAVVLVGDVTGHGVPAALLMAMAKSAVKIRPPDAARAVVPTLEHLNAHLFETIKRKRLMTMLYGVIDAREHRFTFGNAGHSFPYFFSRSTGNATLVECAAYPLGARRQGRFEERQVAFAPGDQLVLYTDGLVEALTEAGHPVGYDGFRQLLEKACGPVGSATEALDGILNAFRQTTGNRPCDDDLTLIVLRRQPPFGGHP